LMARAIVLFASSILALGLVTLYVSREEEQ